MKKTLTIVCLSLFVYNLTGAQSLDPISNRGGGEYKFENTECISPAQRAGIQQMLDQNKAMLMQRGQLGHKVAAPPKFKWPLSQVSSYNSIYKYYYGISNYIDHNAAYPNQLQDWHCGARTYDTQSGYNHAGTDIFLWPFSWKMFNRQQVKVVAAAPGVIIGKTDGNFDKNCSFNSSNWNAVYIQHEDGSVAWYGHLKKNSLTTKNIGDSVITGEVLGRVGSSGNSTGPHLHFEVYDASNTLVDPWKGSCNPIASSWWKSQKNYYESKCNAILTHSAPPVFPTCPGIETLNQSDQFLPGAVVYFASYFHDQQNGQLATYKVFYPNGTLWNSWTNTFTTYYSASWWYWYWTLPANATLGTWNYQIIYQGDTLNHAFTVANALTPETSTGEKMSSSSGFSVYPNPTSGVLSLQLESDQASPCDLVVYSVLGKKMLEQHALLVEGENQLGLNLESLPSGIYFIECRYNDKLVVEKVKRE